MGLWSLEEKIGQEENECPRMDKGLQDFTPPEEEIMGSKGRRERKREGEERRKQKEGERNSDRILLNFSNSTPRNELESTELSKDVLKPTHLSGCQGLRYKRET